MSTNPRIPTYYSGTYVGVDIQPIIRSNWRNESCMSGRCRRRQSVIRTTGRTSYGWWEQFIPYHLLNFPHIFIKIKGALRPITSWLSSYLDHDHKCLLVICNMLTLFTISLILYNASVLDIGYLEFLSFSGSPILLGL